MDKIIEIMRKKIKKGMILELTSKIEDPYSPKEKEDTTLFCGPAKAEE